jgi:cytochrome c-type biogenesis protein
MGIVSRVSGGLLVVFGVLLVTGTWNHWMDLLRGAVGTTGVGSGL